MEIVLDCNNIHDKCRLCLTDSGSMQVLLASNSSHVNEVLLDKISDSLSITISDFENLPTKVCDDCCEQVERAYDFKKKCLDVDTLLRNHVKLKQKERRQSTSHLHNDAPGSDMFSNKERFGVSTEYVSVPSTSTGKLDYASELLKVEVEIKDEEEDEISDGSICSVSDIGDISTSSFKNQPKLEYRISSKRKVKAKSFHENTKFRCPSCRKSYCNKYSLSRHKQSHSKKTFTCSFCDKILTNQESWLRHERMHQMGNRYKCRMCEKSYISSTSYAAHLRKHTGERPYKCMLQGCKDTFYLLSSFERHVAKHRGMKDFKCEICNAAFWVPDDLRAHVNRMH